MPERQKPFVHQDGSTTPATPGSIEACITPHSLRSQVGILDELVVSTQAGIKELKRSGDVMGAEDEQEQLDALIATREALIELQSPSLNTVVSAMLRLPTTHRALLADIALAIVAGCAGQQKLANDLRKLVEGRS